MCLDTITDTSPPTKGVGYKVFKKRDRRLFADFVGPSDLPHPTKKWLDEKGFGWKKKFIEAASKHQYPAGWHIFTTLGGARRWSIGGDRAIRKIRYRHGHTQGTQWAGFGPALNIIIAKEIYIIPGETSG